MYRKAIALLAIGTISLLGLASVEAEAQKTRTVAPVCEKAFGANLCVSGKMSGNNVVEIDALVPWAAISGVPKTTEMKWPPEEGAVVAVPEELSRATGIENLSFYWESMGHPPGPFMTPHFDFHFNTISDADRKAIDCSDSAKPSALPAGYTLSDITVPDLGVLVGTCVPRMGMHALAMAGQPDPFSATMVLGYYHGQPIFFEPMISQATLMAKKRISLAITAPVGAGKVRYPTKFDATFDAKANAYRFAFTGFKVSKETRQ